MYLQTVKYVATKLKKAKEKIYSVYKNPNYGDIFSTYIVLLFYLVFPR